MKRMKRKIADCIGCVQSETSDGAGLSGGSVRRVCIRNQTECKLYEKVRMPGEHAAGFCSCHPWAEIRMDRLELTEEGIRAEGVSGCAYSLC